MSSYKAKLRPFQLNRHVDINDNDAARYTDEISQIFENTHVFAIQTGKMTWFLPCMESVNS